MELHYIVFTLISQFLIQYVASAQNSNELRTILVESGRDDPVFSGKNQAGDNILREELVKNYVSNENSRYDLEAENEGMDGAYNMPGTNNQSNIVHLPAAEYNRMPNRKHSEHIGQDGRFKASICDQPNGFLQKQRNLCLQYIQLMESVVRGYFMGLRECEYQFSAHRWNCLGYNVTLRSAYRRKAMLSTQNSPDRKPKRIRTYMDRLLSSGTRESAYVLAVTSAGISHAVTKACSSGMHDSCGCDRTIYDHERQPNFEWSGCSDNIHFGAAFSRKFLDAREKGRSRRNPTLGLTNLHNNHVGRQAVVNKMDIKCKCHGVSGSCEMRTCWRALPDFRAVGNQLREFFQDAVMVENINNRLIRKTLHYRLKATSHVSGNTNLQTAPPTDSAMVTDVKNSPMPTEKELIYIARSPSYCNHEPQFGSMGTHGRRCSEDSKDTDNCASLCCGRDFRREVYLQEEKCQCQFHWCCEVRCQICKKTVIVSICN